MDEPIQSEPAKDRGKEVEALVEKICTKMFLPDLTIANPKFKKGGKLEKEIADIIIPYRDCLFCFQIKSKTELKPISEKTETDIERIRRRIEDGIGQLKTLRACLKGKLITELKNHRGITLPFDCDSFKKIYGVVILELLGEEKFPEEERTSILSGFDVLDGMPVHIFKLDVFNVISTEIDTIPDFLEYLEVRELLISNGKLNPFTEELDFLAIYKTKQDIIEQLRKGEITHLFIEEGLWKHHVENRKQIIADRNLANEPSYLWDEMMKSLHTSIGFTPQFPAPDSRNDFEQGTAANYYASLLEFSAMRRIERRAAGIKFLEVLARADRKGLAYGFCGVGNGDGVNVVMLSSNKPRQERADFLMKLCITFYCGLGLRKILGIATEPGSYTQRSHDIMCLEDVEIENAEEIRRKFQESAKPNRVTFKEYGSHESNDSPASD
jgi:hypothetical protein